MKISILSALALTLVLSACGSKEPAKAATSATSQDGQITQDQVPPGSEAASVKAQATKKQGKATKPAVYKVEDIQQHTNAELPIVNDFLANIANCGISEYGGGCSVNLSKHESVIYMKPSPGLNCDAGEISVSLVALAKPHKGFFLLLHKQRDDAKNLEFFSKADVYTQEILNAKGKPLATLRLSH